MRWALTAGGGRIFASESSPHSCPTFCFPCALPAEAQDAAARAPPRSHPGASLRWPLRRQCGPARQAVQENTAQQSQGGEARQRQQRGDAGDPDDAEHEQQLGVLDEPGQCGPAARPERSHALHLDGRRLASGDLGCVLPFLQRAPVGSARRTLGFRRFRPTSACACARAARRAQAAGTTGRSPCACTAPALASRTAPSST